MTIIIERKLTEQDYEILENKAKKFMDRHEIEYLNKDDYTPEYQDLWTNYLNQLLNHIDYKKSQGYDWEREAAKFTERQWWKVVNRALGTSPDCNCIAYDNIGVYER